MIDPLARAYLVARRELSRALDRGVDTLDYAKANNAADGRWMDADCPIDVQPAPTDPDPPSAYPVGEDCDGPDAREWSDRWPVADYQHHRPVGPCADCDGGAS